MPTAKAAVAPSRHVAPDGQGASLPSSSPRAWQQAVPPPQVRAVSGGSVGGYNREEMELQLALQISLQESKSEEQAAAAVEAARAAEEEELRLEVERDLDEPPPVFADDGEDDDGDEEDGGEAATGQAGGGSSISRAPTAKAAQQQPPPRPPLQRRQPEAIDDDDESTAEMEAQATLYLRLRPPAIRRGEESTRLPSDEAWFNEHVFALLPPDIQCTQVLKYHSERGASYAFVKVAQRHAHHVITLLNYAEVSLPAGFAVLDGLNEERGSLLCANKSWSGDGPMPKEATAIVGGAAALTFGRGPPGLQVGRGGRAMGRGGRAMGRPVAA